MRCACATQVIEAEKVGVSGPSVRETVAQKHCPACLEVKPAEAFYRSYWRKSGLYPW